MSDFVQSLRNQIEKASGQAAPWGDVNPLVVIGLTEAVLDSGATEDGIYKAIRAYSRQLAADVSPDRNKNAVSDERLAEIMAAFNYIDDRANFTRALADFKLLKAEDRREVRILSQAVSGLRQQLFGLEAQRAAIRAESAKLQESRRDFERQKNEEPIRVPQLEEMLRVLREQATYQNGLLAAERMHHAYWKKRFGYAINYITQLEDNEKPEIAGKFAFEAKWVAVVMLHWDFGFPNLSPLAHTGKARRDFYEAARSVGIKKEEQVLEITKSWSDALASFGTPHRLETRQLPLSFSLIKLSAGKPTKLLYGNRHAAQGGRVIGSVPPTEGMPITRAHLVHALDRESLMENLTPLLIPGGLLVSVKSDKNKTATWSTTLPAPIFSRKRIILAVG